MSEPAQPDDAGRYLQIAEAAEDVARFGSLPASCNPEDFRVLHLMLPYQVAIFRLATLVGDPFDEPPDRQSVVSLDGLAADACVNAIRNRFRTILARAGWRLAGGLAYGSLGILDEEGNLHRFERENLPGDESTDFKTLADTAQTLRQIAPRSSSQYPVVPTQATPVDSIQPAPLLSRQLHERRVALAIEIRNKAALAGLQMDDVLSAFNEAANEQGLGPV